MQEAKILSPLIGELYDAAIDPTLWEPVLRNVAAFVGGHSAGVVVKDASAKTGGWRMTTTCCRRTISGFISRSISSSILAPLGSSSRGSGSRSRPVISCPMKNSSKPASTANGHSRKASSTLSPAFSTSRRPAPRSAVSSVTNATALSTTPRAAACASSRRTSAAPCSLPNSSISKASRRRISPRHSTD